MNRLRLAIKSLAQSRSIQRHRATNSLSTVVAMSVAKTIADLGYTFNSGS